MPKAGYFGRYPRWQRRTNDLCVVLGETPQRDCPAVAGRKRGSWAGSLCSHPHRGQAHTPQVGKGTRRRGATRYLCRGRSGPTNDKRSVPAASALSTSARGTGTLPTTACDGCSPGLPLTTNPPLGRWCDSSGDPAGSGHGTEPSASWRRNRHPDRGVGAPMWRLATALYSCQADTRTPRLVVVTPETGEAPWDG